MTNFPSSHSDVTAVADQTGNFDIYSGAFQAGTICAGSRRSNYTILAAPKKWELFAGDELRGHRRPREKAHDESLPPTVHSPTARPVSAAGVVCAAAVLASLLVALLRLRSWARARVRSLLARAQCRVCLAVSSWRKGDG